jgi:hypothetical protein
MVEPLGLLGVKGFSRGIKVVGYFPGFPTAPFWKGIRLGLRSRFHGR